jgi:hypothetical protein
VENAVKDISLNFFTQIQNIERKFGGAKVNIKLGKAGRNAFRQTLLKTKLKLVFAEPSRFFQMAKRN